MVDDFPPQLSARFRPTALLASGGQGRVYSAVQVGLERAVALKVLRPEAALADENLLDRFRNEARIAARIHHPNVVRVLDHGVEGDLPWIAYELVAGRNLRAIIDGGPVPWRTAVEIARQIASALEAAHALGVWHRDIKPENVLEAADGTFKVTDFGIAKWSGGGAVQTRAGLVLGTPRYIAPEQIKGEPLSGAADQYALGVLLFEIVAGRAPFEDSDVLELLRMHIDAAPPRLEVPEAPVELEQVSARALAKHPHARFADAGAMRCALETTLAADRPAGPARTARRETAQAADKPAARLRSAKRPPAWARIVARVARGAFVAAALATLAAVVGLALKHRGATPPAAASLDIVGLSVDETGFTATLGTADGARPAITHRIPIPRSYPTTSVVNAPGDTLGTTCSVTLTAERAARALLDRSRDVVELAHRMPDPQGYSSENMGSDQLLAVLRPVDDRESKLEVMARQRGVLAETTLWNAHLNSLLAADLPPALGEPVRARVHMIEDLSDCFDRARYRRPPALKIPYPACFGPDLDVPANLDIVEVPIAVTLTPEALRGRWTPPFSGDAYFDDLLGAGLVADHDIRGGKIAAAELDQLHRELASRGFGRPVQTGDSARSVRMIEAHVKIADPVRYRSAWIEVRYTTPPWFITSLRVRVNRRYTIRPPAPVLIGPTLLRSRGSHRLDPRAFVAGDNTFEFTLVGSSVAKDLPFTTPAASVAWCALRSARLHFSTAPFPASN